MFQENKQKITRINFFANRPMAVVSSITPFAASRPMAKIPTAYLLSVVNYIGFMVQPVGNLVNITRNWLCLFRSCVFLAE